MSKILKYPSIIYQIPLGACTLLKGENSEKTLTKLKKNSQKSLGQLQPNLAHGIFLWGGFKLIQRKDHTFLKKEIMFFSLNQRYGSFILNSPEQLCQFQLDIFDVRIGLIIHTKLNMG